MIGNKQDAEDVLQDAFVNAYLKIHQLRSLDSFGAWIKRIVINQNIQFLRSQIMFADIDDIKAEMETQEETQLEAYSMIRINEEIKQLPDGCRIIFNLFLLENYSHKEIAEILNISESTSKSQYRRARHLLQKRLKEKANYGQI